jgi:hypothetical protein
LTPYNSLIPFTFCFWVVAWASIKLSNLLAGRPLSDGPSLLPLILVFPPATLLLGVALNWIYPYLGTAIVICSHVAYIIYGLFFIRSLENTSNFD